MAWYKIAPDARHLSEGDIIDLELTAADLGLWTMVSLNPGDDGLVSERRLQLAALALRHSGWRRSLERLASVGLITAEG